MTFDPGQDFSGVKIKAKVAGRPCDSTSGNLNKTSVREVQRCLSANRLSFSKLFKIFRLR